MKILLFIILTGYAVKCEDNNYYVIEVPEEPLRSQKSFKVYWNVPTMQCASKKIPFENLYEKFGIIQNKNDRFKGDKVVILYDPGDFPALFKNESSGKFRFRNGGVPQQGNLDIHLMKFRQDLDESVPDENFNGVGIIDFESWRPVFRQNFGTLQPYKDVSIEIERTLHPWWKKHSIEAEAKSRFTASARSFMETTLVMAKTLRPHAIWGFYGFPYCFNMAANNMYESCARKVPEENDDIPWLWSSSSALFPSVYSSNSLSTSQLASLIKGRVKEAARHRKDNILPYFWFRHRDGGFLNQKNLDTALYTLFKSAATGILVWGSSHDVNTVDKCNLLHDYIYNTFGPAIAKYTKPTRYSDATDERLNEIYNTTQNITDETERPIINDILNITTKIDNLDPEFYWTPPENYTEDIKENVKDEINKKIAQTDAPTVQNNNFLDYVLNYVLNIDRNNSIDSKDDFSLEDNVDLSSTTESTKLSSTEASQVTNNVVTNSEISVQIDIADIKTTEGTKSVRETTESYIFDKKESNKYFNANNNFEGLIDTASTTSEEITTTVEPSYETTDFVYSTIDAIENFFDTDAFLEDVATTTNDYTTTDLLITEKGEPKFKNKATPEYSFDFESTTEYKNGFNIHFNTERSTQTDDYENFTEVYKTNDSDITSTTENDSFELFSSSTPLVNTRDKILEPYDTNFILYEPVKSSKESKESLENTSTTIIEINSDGNESFEVTISPDFGTTSENTEVRMIGSVEQVDLL